MLTLAISRGRIWQEALSLLQALGFSPNEEALRSRQLIIPTASDNVRLVQVRAQDAPVFVARGAAQAGIAGGDVLAEKPMSEIVSPLDLRIATCRLVIATPLGFDENTAGNRPAMVATKYPNLTKAHFAARGRQVNIVKLHGAMELAPLVGLADMLVDVADSGRTLRENGLIEKEKIMDISAMLIVNRTATRRLPAVAALQRDMAALLEKS
ncbi:ATP phosphoribosyltransferase [Candidatus Persebacteraceae bacterium Df01]|jgi:ATP phosphoribosyltransferase|uniref:ATP phosphoribosyltransferase n=1 Tax=Candidatus Doriopsillibacter californiensis TaxID=2970740 RepID=A0ABT7QJT3_9GAMM|nr:ATP phosphoribosyltransferase [Candidatus Persebacteraceae bacterium Df01]